MSLNNGRSTYEQLTGQFSKVRIVHHRNEDGTGRTTCLLATENEVHVGVAKFSNRTFNFSKKKGRVMAQGRAELAVQIYRGESNTRESQKTRREQLSYTIKATEGHSVEDIIAEFFHNSES